jgi:hypothetical protein
MDSKGLTLGFAIDLRKEIIAIQLVESIKGTDTGGSSG